MGRYEGLGLAWLGIVTLAAIVVAYIPLSFRSFKVSRWLTAACLLAGLVRLVPALWGLPADALVRWDIDSYRAVVDALAQRHDVYAIAGRYPYLPFHMYLMAGASWLATHTPLPFVFWVKVPPIMADMALTVTVGVVAGRLGYGRTTALRAALLFALNPISVMVTGYHGQFDAEPVALTLVAWAVLVYCRRPWSIPVAGLLLGLAIADKTWPVLLAPILYWRLDSSHRRAMFVLFTGVPVLLSLVVYEIIVPGGAIHAIQVSAGYQGVPGVWGISQVVALVAGPDGKEAALLQLQVLGPLIMAAAFGFAYVAAARLSRDIDRMALVIATLYAVAAGWGTHWLSWLAPLALLSGRRWASVYLSAAAVWCAVVYAGFGGVFWTFAWWFGTFQPGPMVEQAGLVLWAGIALAVVGVWGLSLGPDVLRAVTVLLNRRPVVSPPQAEVAGPGVDQPWLDRPARRSPSRVA